MRYLKRLVVQEAGQGLTEYSLILGLMIFGVWLAVQLTGLGPAISALFADVVTQVTNCSSGTGC